MGGSVACELFGEVLHHVVTLWFTVDEDVEAQLFLLGNHQLDLIDHGVVVLLGGNITAA